MANKRCPHCGGNTFLAKVIRAARVQAQEDGTFKILQETPNYDIEIVKCSECKNDLTEAELLELVPCKNCGTLTNPKDLNTDGVCDVCQALTVRPDLANASKEDIIRMLLHLEASTKKTPISESADQTPTHVEEKVEQPVEEVKPEITQTAADKIAAARQAMANASEQLEDITSAPAEEAQKTTRKKRAVKKSTTAEDSTEDTAEDVSEEATEVEVPNTEPIEEIMNGTVPDNFINPPTPDQAPFPEQDQVMQEMFGQQPQQDIPPLPQGGFPLFNNNEESF